MGVGTDDEDNTRVLEGPDRTADPPRYFGETEQDGVSGKTTSELQTPMAYTGIYDTWDDEPGPGPGQCGRGQGPRDG